MRKLFPAIVALADTWGAYQPCRAGIGRTASGAAAGTIRAYVGGH